MSNQDNEQEELQKDTNKIVENEDVKERGNEPDKAIEKDEDQIQSSKLEALKHIRRADLLLIGGLIWVIFGVILIFQGYTQMIRSEQSPLLYMVIAIAVFYGAFVYIFKNLAQKYSNRILNKKQEHMGIWKVFNIEGYLIMALLVMGGFYIGALDNLNPIFWAPIYIGLGIALVAAGALYWLIYIREKLSFGKKKKK